MGARPQGVVTVGVIQQALESATPRAPRGRTRAPTFRPHDERRPTTPRLAPRTRSPAKPVGVAGEQEPLGDAEPAVVPGERVGARPQVPPGSSWRQLGADGQRSGKTGVLSVVHEYSAPLDPPVPRFVPMVRCTIFTCR